VEQDKFMYSLTARIRAIEISLFESASGFL